MATDVQVNPSDLEIKTGLTAEERLSRLRADAVRQVLPSLDKAALADIVVHGAQQDADFCAHAFAYAALQPTLRPDLALLERVIDAVRQPGDFDLSIQALRQEHPMLTATTAEDIFTELLNHAKEKSIPDAEILTRYALRRFVSILETMSYMFIVEKPDFVQRAERTFEHLLKLHIELCTHCDVPVEELADFVLELQLAHELDLTDKLVNLYSELLKAEGLGHYQRDLEAICREEQKRFIMQFPDYDKGDDDQSFVGLDEDDADDGEAAEIDEDEEFEAFDEDDDEDLDDQDVDDDDEGVDDEDDEDDEDEVDPTEEEFQAERLERLTGLLDRVAGETREFETLASILGSERRHANDYVAIVEMYNRHRDFSSAILSGEEAIGRFGVAKCPFELHRLLAESHSQTGNPNKAIEVYLANFEAKLTLSSYAALRYYCLEQSESCWKEWQPKAIAALQSKLAASAEVRKGAKLPAGNTRLVQVHLFDEDFEPAWAAAASGCSVAGLLVLGQQSLKQCFDIALPILQTKIDELILANDDFSDEQACLLLDQVKMHCRDKADKEKLQQILREIRSKYPLRHKLFKQFKKHRLW